MRAYYGVRIVTLDEAVPAIEDGAALDTMGNPTGESINKIQLDFSNFDTINYDTNVDVGASSYWSELMQVQTMDNLFTKGIMTDAVLYLESIPSKYLKNKDKIIAAVKEQQAMMAQQAAMPTETPPAEMPITEPAAQELVNQVAEARREIMNQSRQ